MTTDDLITGILEREGGYDDNPADHGGPTNRGITAAAWGVYCAFGRPATRAEVEAITEPQAREFYRRRYIVGSPFAPVPSEALRCQLIDFAINSGTARALRWLQRILDVPVTGVMDARTQEALRRDRGALVNNALVAARVRMYRGLVADDASQAEFLEGWMNRALSFLELTI